MNDDELDDGLNIDALSGGDDEAHIEDDVQDGDPGQPEAEGHEAEHDESDGDMAAGDNDGDGETVTEQGAQEENTGGQTVPLAVLLDERKGFQGRLDEMNTKFGRFEHLAEELQTYRDDKAKAPEAIPTEYLDDPQGYIDEQVKIALDAAKETSGAVTEIRETQDHNTQMNALNNRLASFDDAFVKAGNDDYQASLDHIRQVNIDNGVAMGLTEADATTQAAQAMFAVQAQVAQSGRDPAKYMYEMAGRWGYTKAAPVPDPDNKGDDEGDETMDTLIAGEKAGSMGGGAAPSLEDITEMEDDEFAEIMTEEFGGKFVR